MNIRTLITGTTLAVLTTGCVAKTPYPSTWDARSESGKWCASPAGAFTNAPLLATPETKNSGELKLELKEVFFGNELNGFDVTHLTFDSLASGVVVVKPWIGERALKEEARIDRKRGQCRDGAWGIKTTWVAQPGAAMAGLLWTGGILMPMATRATFELELNAAGDLAAHATLHTSGTTFLFFPMRTRDADKWYLYTRWTHAEDNQPVTK